MGTLPPTSTELYQSARVLVSIISAIITFFAVLVALFKDWFWEKIKKPILSVKFEMGPPFCIKTKAQFSEQQPTQHDVYYFRLKIDNEGTQTANRVQVYVNKVSRKHTDDLYYDERQFQPMNLKWSNTNNPAIYVPHILPNMGKFCDLGHIIDPIYRQYYSSSLGVTIPGDAATFLFELDIEVPPNTGSHLLKIGEYKIELLIAAENVKPVTKDIILNFRGPWNEVEDIMYRDGIGIRIE